MNRSIAFFDFDGTLTRGDTLIPFLRMVRGAARLGLDLLSTSPTLVGYALGIVPNHRAKEALLRSSIGGLALEYLQAQGRSFAEHHLPSMLRKVAVERFLAHRANGDICVLVSASLDVYLQPWARSFGFDYCIATTLEIDKNGNITGRLQGGNCFGDEKVRRIDNLLSEIGRPLRSYAYGDSRGDMPMLSMVDEGFWVERDSCITKFK